MLVQRAPGSELGFDFFAMKSWYGTPVVADTDGALRWVGAGVGSSMASLCLDNGFLVDDTGAPRLTRLEFDGTSQQTALVTSRVANFHHNLDPGKVGILGNVDILSGGVQDVESSLIEFGHSGVVLREWDFAAILRDYMQSQGDDPSGFVRSGYDWFHMNAAAYDARDDSITVSSRENFVIKVDYSTGRIRWILGDPNKYWYTFASLRANAVTLEAGGLYPIGQHATSITSDGLLMLFNNGWQSFNQPAGAPTGESRSYSAVSVYYVDDQARTAREVRRFDYAQTVQSIVCSSAYEAAGKSLLISYAFAGGGTQARLVGLDSNQRVVFDLQYPNTPACNTSWNAVPVPLGQMRFDEGR